MITLCTNCGATRQTNRKPRVSLCKKCSRRGKYKKKIYQKRKESTCFVCKEDFPKEGLIETIANMGSVISYCKICYSRALNLDDYEAFQLSRRSKGDYDKKKPNKIKFSKVDIGAMVKKDLDKDIIWSRDQRKIIEELKKKPIPTIQVREAKSVKGSPQDARGDTLGDDVDIYSLL